MNLILLINEEFIKKFLGQTLLGEKYRGQKEREKESEITQLVMATMFAFYNASGCTHTSLGTILILCYLRTQYRRTEVNQMPKKMQLYFVN